MISHNWELIKALFTKPHYTSRWCQGKEAMQCISHTVTRGHRGSLDLINAVWSSFTQVMKGPQSYSPPAVCPVCWDSRGPEPRSPLEAPGHLSLGDRHCLAPHSLPAAVALGPCPVLTLSHKLCKLAEAPLWRGRDSGSCPELGPLCTR